MGDNTGKPSKMYNIAHSAEIWKDHIYQELKSSRLKWPQTYGFLVHEYKKMNRMLEGKPLTPVSPGSRHVDKPYDSLTLPPIPVKNCNLPRTSNDVIGHKPNEPCPDISSLGPFCRYGEQGHGQYTMHRHFSWGEEALP